MFKDQLWWQCLVANSPRCASKKGICQIVLMLDKIVQTFYGNTDDTSLVNRKHDFNNRNFGLENLVNKAIHVCPKYSNRLTLVYIQHKLMEMNSLFSTNITLVVE